jgi:peptide chain release factor 1
MLADPDLDEEMKALARHRRSRRLQSVSKSCRQALQFALLPKDKADQGGVILEVRAGTGRR